MHTDSLDGEYVCIQIERNTDNGNHVTLSRGYRQLTIAGSDYDLIDLTDGVRFEEGKTYKITISRS